MGHDDDQISIQSIMDDLRNVQGDQGKLDDLYSKLVSGMKSRLKKSPVLAHKGATVVHKRPMCLAKSLAPL